MHAFTTKILTHHLYHPKRTQSQTHHCLPCILLEDTDWSLFCAFSVQLPAFSGAVCVIEMIFFKFYFLNASVLWTLMIPHYIILMSLGKMPLDSVLYNAQNENNSPMKIKITESNNMTQIN